MTTSKKFRMSTGFEGGRWPYDWMHFRLNIPLHPVYITLRWCDKIQLSLKYQQYIANITSGTYTVTVGLQRMDVL